MVSPSWVHQWPHKFPSDSVIKTYDWYTRGHGFNRWFALQPCWCTKQKKISSHSLHKNGSYLPEEKNLIVPVHQHGPHDITRKPSIPFWSFPIFHAWGIIKITSSSSRVLSYIEIVQNNYKTKHPTGAKCSLKIQKIICSWFSRCFVLEVFLVQ